MPLGTDLSGYATFGKGAAGGGVLPASYAEAQGEQLGASTQNAIEQAQLRAFELQAKKDYEGKIKNDPTLAPHAGAIAGASNAGYNPEQQFSAVNTANDVGYRAGIADPNTPPEQRVANAQALSPAGLANPLTDANQQLALARAADANSHVPVNGSIVGLNNAHAAYYNRSPGEGMGMQVGQFSPQLQEAISKGLIDPKGINSRNWRAYDQIAQNDPSLDWNAAHGNAAAQSNVGLQTKMAVLNALPGNINQMVTLGSKVNYPDAKFAGEAKKWVLGQSNDDDLAAYMGVRNDTLLNLASVMRGVGMSDQAHTAELEAASPTMPPHTLEAWAKEQQALVARRQQMYGGITHRDIHGGAGAPAPRAPGGTTTPTASPATAPGTTPGGAPTGVDGKPLW